MQQNIKKMKLLKLNYCKKLIKLCKSIYKNIQQIVMDYFAIIDLNLETKKLQKLTMGRNATKVCYANMIQK